MGGLPPINPISWSRIHLLQLILGCTCGRQSQFLLGKVSGSMWTLWKIFGRVWRNPWKTLKTWIYDDNWWVLEQIPSPSKLLKSMNQCNFLPIIITKPSSYCPPIKNVCKLLCYHAVIVLICFNHYNWVLMTKPSYCHSYYSTGLCGLMIIAI
jgi:hypothetical protein